MLPASFSALASGESSRELTTMGWQVRPRVLAMNAVLVPLPAPGCAAEQDDLLGEAEFLGPPLPPGRCQTPD
jgi:hypothetical protein